MRGLDMLTKETYEKAQNMEVKKVFENERRIEFLVGYIVTFHKKQEKFTCDCKADVVYAVPVCAHRIVAATKGKGIPKKVKEAVEEEIDELR